MQEESITALRSELDIVKANKALELGDYVKVDPNAQNGVKGPNIVFSGANVHVTSGSGSTDDGGVALTGLGNLIGRVQRGAELIHASREPQPHAWQLQRVYELGRARRGL